MQIREVGEDYEETVGKIHRFRKEIDGKMPGDPVRAAKVIADIEAGCITITQMTVSNIKVK
ncbi:hypothetical protein [Paenibacillus medicaginis]|uniref:Uncharacterized protein n=1 Tax=Paenibacillus medicaginis TaxID=1470560 RepID=A0ABV5BYU0_9BACL